jgi:hypothetical protein
MAHSRNSFANAEAGQVERRTHDETLLQHGATPDTRRVAIDGIRPDNGAASAPALTAGDPTRHPDITLLFVSS